MQKNFYFISPNQPHFIEVSNNLSVKKTFKIHFSGDSLDIFKLEGVSASTYDSFENGYTIEVNPNESKFLEIFPNVGNSSIDSFVFAIIESTDFEIINVFKLNLNLRKEDYSKNLSKYSTLERKFKEKEKHEFDTYALYETNPFLTGNVKLRIDSNQNLYLTIFDNILETNDDRLFNRIIKKGSDYFSEISKLFKILDRKTETFYNLVSNDLREDSNLSSQINDDLYKAGVKYFPSKAFNEKFSIFAPLYIEQKIPSHFVIFKRNTFKDLEKSSLFKDLEIVKTFDLTESTELGKFLKRTIEYNDFEKSHIESKINENSILLEITGYDPLANSISSVYVDSTQFIESESKLIDFEKFVTESYSRRNMISHRIINFEFLFDDLDAEDGDYTSYFGMFVDDLNLESFSLDFGVYGNDIFNKCLVNNVEKSSEFFIDTKLKNVETFLNDGHHVFYIQDSSKNFSTISKIEDKKITLTKEKSPCDFLISSEEQVYINPSKIIENPKPFVNLNFKSDILDNTKLTFIQNNEKYEMSFVNSISLPETILNKKKDFVLETSLIATKNQLEVSNFLEIKDNQRVILIDEDENEIEVRSTHTQNDGESTRFTFSDSITLDNINHIKISLESSKEIQIEIGQTNNNTLKRLEEKINSLEDFPFSIVVNDSNLSIISNASYPFKIGVDVSKSNMDIFDIQRFEEEVISNTSTILDVDYEIQYREYDSIFISNEDFYIVDDYERQYLEDGKFLLLGDNKSLKLPLIEEGKYVITHTDNSSYVIRIPKNLGIKKIFKSGISNFGLFSFYDVKKFDTDKMTTSYEFLKEEYRKFYNNFGIEEVLTPRQIYVAENFGSEPIVIELRYVEEGKFDFKTLKEISIPPFDKVSFSTFLTDYEINSYSKNIEFRYFFIEGGVTNLRVYNKNVFDDPDLKKLEPEFPNSSFISENLETYIKDQKDIKRNANFINYYDARSEYVRLQEVSNNFNISDVLDKSILKWGSKNKDSKSQPMRLNFSPSLGLTNYSSSFSNFKSSEDLHSHEWFIFDEVPSYVNLYEGVEGNYGFSKISNSLLLNTSYDYFEEYFTNGHLGISKGSLYPSLNKKENYSKLVNVSEDLYETLFKGVKYRFASASNLNNYKFSILTETRPDTTTVSNIINHCPEDFISSNCLKDGVLPKLKHAIDNLSSGNQTVDIKLTYAPIGLPVNLEDEVSISSFRSGTLFTDFQFQSEVNFVLSKWKATLERLFSVNKGFGGNLKVNFTTDFESSGFPLNNLFIPDAIKEAEGIGDIRIAFTKFSNSEIAKSSFVTNEQFESGFEYLTPSILFNSDSFFRLNSDVNSSSAYSLQYVFAHELGHVFGLGHIDIIGSLMNPVIKQSYNLGNIDGDDNCVFNVYGNPSEIITEGENTNYTNSTIRNRKHDSFEFIVNDTFKTITLKIYVDLPNYTSFDSKKSFAEMYFSNSLKRIIRFNDFYTLEGIDLKIPSINLSPLNLSFFNENLLAKSNDVIDENSVGINPLQSAYRTRNLVDSIGNLSIDHFVLNYINEGYLLNRSFGSTGEQNKATISKISNGSDTSVDIALPLLNNTSFLNSFSYRIAGGDSIISGNYKLTLDYLYSISNDIPITGTSNKFDFSIVPLKNIKIENLKYPISLKDNYGTFFELEETKNAGNLLRYESQFDPLVDTLIYFSVHDDYELSSLYSIDFFKLNTRINHKHPNFGTFFELSRKISDTKVDTDERFSLYLNNTKVFNKEYSIWESSFDDLKYSYFLTNKDNIFVSGFYDPLLTKNILNNVIPILPNEFTIKANSSEVKIVENSNLKVRVNTDSILRRYLKTILLNKYSEIYNLTEIDVDKSLEKFISNNFINLYNILNINLYSKESNAYTYNSNLNLQFIDSRFEIKDKTTNDILIEGDLSNGRKIDFYIEVKFNFI